MNSIKSIIQMSRPLNCVMAALAVLIGASISLGFLAFNIQLLLLMLSALLICAGGQIINDYYDINIDRLTKPNKAIVKGNIKPKQAFMWAMGFFALGIILSFFVNFHAIIIAIIFAILLFVYSAKLKKLKYIGNFVVAFATGFTLIYGATISTNYLLIIILAFSATMANLVREIIKDLEDEKSDKGKKTTLAHLLNKKSILYIVFTYLILGILSSYVPVILVFFKLALPGFNSIPYVLLISIANAGFIYTFKLAMDKEFKTSQNFAKISMLIALIAFFITIFL